MNSGSYTINQLITKDDTNLEQVLSLGAAISSIPPDAVEYFCNNASKLLDIALKPEINGIVLQAYSLLNLPKIQEKILQSNDLQRISEEILQPGVSNLRISKFSDIIQSMLKRFPKLAFKNCPFIPKLVDFAQYSAVETLISELLKAKDEETYIFDYLIEMQLPRIVSEAIVNKDDINNDNCAGLYRIIRIFANYPAIQKLFQNDVTVDVLFVKKNPTDRHVLSAQWNSITHLMNSETLLFFLPLVEKAMNIVKGIGKEVWQHHVFCFDFLTKMSVLDEAQPLMKGIADPIINVIKNFPDHTIILSSVVKLSTQIALIPEFGITEMMNILPVVELMIKERKSIIVSAWCFKLIRDVRQLTPEMSKLVASLSKETLEIVESTKEVIDKPYGGIVPKSENYLTPEQSFYYRFQFPRRF